MPEITWRNVNSIANSGGVQQAIGNLQHSLTALGNVGTKYIDRRMAIEDEYRKNLKEDNTNAIINQMQQVQDMQQLAQAKATGVYDLGALQHLSGGMIDGKQFNTAYGSWDKNTLDKVQTADTALDYTPEAQQALARYADALSKGDNQAMTEAIQGIPLSLQRKLSLGSSTYSVFGDNYKRTTEALERDLKYGEQINKAQENLNAIKNSPEIQDSIRANVDAIQSAYQSRINAATTEEQKQFLADERDRAIANTEAKILADNKEYQNALNQYNQAQQGRNVFNNFSNINTLPKSGLNGQPQTPLKPDATAAELRNYAVAEFAKYGLPEHVVSAYIGTESAFKTKAKNPNSTAAGLGQILESTWNGAAKKLGLPLVTKENRGTDQDPRYNPELNLQVSAYEASEAYKNTKAYANSAGYTDEGMIVKAGIFFGSAGANKIWRALQNRPNTPIENLVSAQVIKSNPFLKGKTAKTAMDYFENLVNNSYGSKKTNATNARNALASVLPVNTEGTQVADNIVKRTQESQPKEAEKQSNILNKPANIVGIENDSFDVRKAIEQAQTHSNDVAQALNNRAKDAKNNLVNMTNSVDTKQNEASAKFMKGIKDKDPKVLETASKINPIFKNTDFLERADKEVGKAVNSVKSQVKDLKAQLLQGYLNKDVAGAVTSKLLAEPENEIEIQVGNKETGIYGLQKVSRDTINREFKDLDTGKLLSKDKFSELYNKYFGQEHFFDQWSFEDNVYRAMEQGVEPAKVVELFNDALKSTNSETYQKGELVDLGFSGSGQLFGKQLQNQLTALATLSSNESLPSIRTDLARLDKIEESTKNPAIQQQLVYDLAEQERGSGKDKAQIYNGDLAKNFAKATGLAELIEGNKERQRLNRETNTQAKKLLEKVDDYYDPSKHTIYKGSVYSKNVNNMMIHQKHKWSTDDIESIRKILASGAKGEYIDRLKEVALRAADKDGRIKIDLQK